MLFLKFRRIELGLSQNELAERANVSQPTVSQAERGRLVPTDIERAALAAVLGCDPASLTKHVSAASLGDGAEALAR